MTLSERQRLFAKLVPRLIDKIYSSGDECTLGEALRTQEMADLYAKQGKGIKNSLHLKKLAIDLNLFKGGQYVSDTEAHRPYGEFWETLHPRCRWGGRFKDGNHYELQEGD